MLEFVHHLGLPAMLAVTLVIMVALAATVTICVRVGVRLSGYVPTNPMPLTTTVLTVVGGIFALMLAFSAASIWTDTLQARAAVQREANALENALGLANGLTPELRDTVRNSVTSYAQGVVDNDWPAMERHLPLGDWVYGNSDRVLVHLIDHLAAETARGGAPQIMAALLGQLFEARSARVARLTLASAGLTDAQWWALVLMLTVVMTALALSHAMHHGFQIVAMALYATTASAAFFVLLAHDQPFGGAFPVSSAPLVQIATRY